MSTTNQRHSVVKVDQPKTEIMLPVGYRVPLRRNSEQVDELLRRIYQGMLANDDPVALGIVGSGEKSAASALTTNLAVRAADFRIKPTLIVDTHNKTRTKGMRRRLRLRRRQPGLFEYSSGQERLEDCVCPTKVEDVHVMGYGRRRFEKSDCYYAGALKAMGESYRLTVIEFPPKLRPAGLNGLLGELDGVIVVGQFGQDRRELDQLIRTIRTYGGELAGMVMTGRPSRIPRWLNIFSS